MDLSAVSSRGWETVNKWWLIGLRMDYILSRQVAGCSRLLRLVGTDEMLLNAPSLSHVLHSPQITAIMHFSGPLHLPLSFNSC